MSEEIPTEDQPEAGPDPIVLATKAISGVVTPLLQEHDPRAVVIGLLMNAVRLTTQILKAKRWTAQQAVGEFSQAMCAMLEPQEESRIQVVDATGRAKR